MLSIGGHVGFNIESRFQVTNLKTRGACRRPDLSFALASSTLRSMTSSPLDIQSHLDQVSRSFAFCIARLDAPLNAQVGLGYLLCRILDTIEDAKWNEAADRFRAFDEYLVFLKSKESLHRAKVWAEEILRETTGVPDGERRLLEDSKQVFETLHAFPLQVREALVPAIESMAHGMRHFAHRSDSGELRLSNLSDVNHYCFFVAGVVGEILEGLLRVRALEIGCDLGASRLHEAFRFGLFLQKVNILKDEAGDRDEGRSLVPNRREVLASAIADGRMAFDYVLSIPKPFESYRLFCAWSLFLGLASLRRTMSGERLGRVETLLLLHSVERSLMDDLALRTLFGDKEEPLLEEFRSDESQVPEFSKEIAASDQTRQNGETSERTREMWLREFRDLYKGTANDEDLESLRPLIVSF